MIAGYTRVSTPDQTDHSQRNELDDYCRRRGWSVRFFTDAAVSGVTTSRKGLDELMALVRRGKVDTIVVFKLDRLARSIVHLAQIIAELQAHRVALVVPSQGIDTTNANPAATLQINVLAAVGQFEREIIVERVNAGLRAAKERGIRLGRPPKNQHKLPLVAALLREGLSAAEIGRRLGLANSTASEIVREIRAAGARPEGGFPPE
jgi:putative DNA-invertase from lambdoid prophage Rac